MVSCSPSSERSRLDARSQQPEMTRAIIECKWQKNVGDDQSTLTLKLLGRVILSPKQMVLVAPQNGPRFNKNFKKKFRILFQFWKIFPSISDNHFQAYDPELFSKALPCLSAIACALSPDYTLTNQDDTLYREYAAAADGSYNPEPVDITRFVLLYI